MATKKATKEAVKATPTPSGRLAAIGIEAICSYVASGNSLRAWSIESGFEQRTVLNWIEADSDRASHYARAREDRADAVFESLDDVSEQAVIAANAVEVAGLRLKADNIKWKLARMSAKKYGDKVELEHSGSLSVKRLTDDQLMELAAKGVPDAR